MDKTIGQYLDNPNEFFWKYRNVIASLTVLNATLESGFLEHIGDEASSIEQLSAACGIPADKLKRLVYFLAAEEIVTLTAEGKVEHTSRSRNLPSIKSLIDCTLISVQAGLSLNKALLEGMTPYEYHFGKPVFEDLADKPEMASTFADYMLHITKLAENFIFTQHEFKPFNLAIDIGGSHGGLLLKLLAQHTSAEGILFDLPEVTAMFQDEVGKAEHGERVKVIGGDFFTSVPSADLYLLKMILHDWDDAQCIQILKTIRSAIAPGGRVAIIDHVLPEEPQPHPGLPMDLAMMIWSTGRERKLSEFKDIFTAAGFSFDSISNNPDGPCVVELVAV